MSVHKDRGHSVRVMNQFLDLEELIARQMGTISIETGIWNALELVNRGMCRMAQIVGSTPRTGSVKNEEKRMKEEMHEASEFLERIPCLHHGFNSVPSPSTLFVNGKSVGWGIIK